MRKLFNIRFVTCGIVGLLTLAIMFQGPALMAEEGDAIAIAKVEHDGPVDFEKEILPIFRRNCLACHNATDAESDLVLETPQTISKGGAEGPVVVAGKPGMSSLLLLAARQQESYMPPDDNDVGAKKLTSQELGLINLWILEGAKGTVAGNQGPSWQPLPAGVNPVYTVAVSPDGQYAAAGRANQIFIYHVPTKREIGRLSDAEITKQGIYKQPGVAFMDLVQSLTFSADSNLLAAGGFRTVKVWERSPSLKFGERNGLADVPNAISVSSDGKMAALALNNGSIVLVDAVSGKITKTLTGHAGAVSSVQWSADQSLIFSAGADKTIRSWTVADGKQQASLETPAPIHALALVSEGQQIAAASEDKTIRIWALPGSKPAADPAAEAAKKDEEKKDEKPAEPMPPKPIRELAGHTGPVLALVATADKQSQLVSAGQDGTVRHWQVADGKLIRQMSHGAPVTAVAVRPDGSRIVSTSENKTVKLWNAADGKQVVELKGNFRESLQLEKLKRQVALATRHLDLAKKDLDEGNKRKKSEEDNLKKSQEADKKAAEDLVKKVEAAKKPMADKAAADKTLETANKTKVTAEATQKTADKANTDAAAALKKGQTDANTAKTALAAATKAAQDAAAKQKQADDAAKKDAANADLKKAAADAATAAQAAEEKRKVAEKASQDAAKVVTDLTAKQKVAADGKKKADADLAKATNDAKAADANVKKLAPVAQKAVDEKTASERAAKAAKRTVERATAAVKKATDAIPGFDAIVKKKEAEQKQEQTGSEASQKAATEAEKPWRTAAFSADGSSFVVAGDDHKLHLFDAETGRAIEVLEGHTGPVSAAAFLPDNRLLTASADKSVVAWSTQVQWNLKQRIGDGLKSDVLADRVTAMHFSSDGKLLATGGGEPSRSGEIKIWNVADGKLVQALKEPHSDTVFALEFSRDGQYIASSAADRFVKVFQVSDGKFVRAFEGHTHHVLGVSWSADGRTLASSGADKVIKIWDFRTGDQQRTIAGFSKEVTAIKFVGDSVNVVASSGDKSVQMKKTDNGGNVRSFAGSGDYVYAVSCTADGKIIAAGGQDSIVRIWSDDGKEVVKFSPPEPAEKPAEAGGGSE
ncbi:MAG: hypothetical protein GY917_29655 [Planctomycetaceae bacterium]|nr:hypothetical protein [Planctomycetaceae bacterium]